jgi:hypothetical protein
VLDMPAPVGRHWTTNYLIDGDAEAASARMYLAMVNQDEIGVTGIYHDTLAKADGRWRFEKRHVLLDTAP